MTILNYLVLFTSDIGTLHIIIIFSCNGLHTDIHWFSAFPTFMYDEDTLGPAVDS